MGLPSRCVCELPGLSFSICIMEINTGPHRLTGARTLFSAAIYNQLLNLVSALLLDPQGSSPPPLSSVQLLGDTCSFSVLCLVPWFSEEEERVLISPAFLVVFLSEQGTGTKAFLLVLGMADRLRRDEHSFPGIWVMRHLG